MLYENETNDLLILIQNIGNKFEFEYTKLKEENIKLKQELKKIKDEEKKIINQLYNNI